MKTPINSLIKWIDDMQNSIFALNSSEMELKMLAQFKDKLTETLPLEEEFALQSFSAGCDFMEYAYENPLADDHINLGFPKFIEKYK